MTFLAKDMKNTHYLVNQGYPVNLVDNQFSKPSIILRQDLLKQTFRASKKDFSFKFMVIISTFVITFNPTRPNLNCIIKKTATFFGVLILKIPFLQNWDPGHTRVFFTCHESNGGKCNQLCRAQCRLSEAKGWRNKGLCLEEKWRGLSLFHHKNNNNNNNI